MKALAGAALLGLVLAACQPHTAQDPDACFIEGLDASDASDADRVILLQAQADFCAVLAGREPLHAKPDDESPLPADGGTHFYVAPHYGLIVMRRLSTFGQAHGMVVGPVLTFKEPFAAGNSQTISATRIVLQAKR